MSNDDTTTVEPTVDQEGTVDGRNAGKVKLRTAEELREQHSGYFNPLTGEEEPLGQTIHDVPIPDGNGGTAYAPADAPGNPSVTTSPVEDDVS